MIIGGRAVDQGGVSFDKGKSAKSESRTIPFTSRIDAARAARSLPEQIQDKAMSLLTEGETQSIQKVDSVYLYKTSIEQKFYEAVALFCLSKLLQLQGSDNDLGASLSHEEHRAAVLEVSALFEAVSAARHGLLLSAPSSGSFDENTKFSLLEKDDSQQRRRGLKTEPATQPNIHTPRQYSGPTELEAAAAFDKHLVALQSILSPSHTFVDDNQADCDGQIGTVPTDSAASEVENVAIALSALAGVTVRVKAGPSSGLTAFTSLREIGNAQQTLWILRCAQKQAARAPIDPLSSPHLFDFLSISAKSPRPGAASHSSPRAVQPDGSRLPHKPGPDLCHHNAASACTRYVISSTDGAWVTCSQTEKTNTLL